MKRTVLIIMLALICAASQAQVNLKMQQLFDKLTELGEAPRIVKSGGKDRPVRLDYSVHLYYSPNMYLGVDSLSLDSILREEVMTVVPAPISVMAPLEAMVATASLLEE